MQQEIAGYLKDKIAEKENPEGERVLLAGNGKLFVHRQRREPNVDAINERNNVKNKDEGNDSGSQFLDRSLLDRDCGGCGI